MAPDDLGDVDVDDGRRTGVREVLGGRPHQGSAGRALERLDGGAESASPEQGAAPRAQRRHDGHLPGAGVLCAREPEELECVHPRKSLGVAPAAADRRHKAGACEGDN